VPQQNRTIHVNVSAVNKTDSSYGGIHSAPTNTEYIPRHDDTPIGFISQSMAGKKEALPLNGKNAPLTRPLLFRAKTANYTSTNRKPWGKDTVNINNLTTKSEFCLICSNHRF